MSYDPNRPDHQRRGPVDDPTQLPGYDARALRPSASDMAEMHSAIVQYAPELLGFDGTRPLTPREQDEQWRARWNAEHPQERRPRTPAQYQTNYGRVVTLNAQIPSAGVWTPQEDTESTWVVTVQPLYEPGPVSPFISGSNDLTFLTVNVTWMVGGATFQKQYFILKAVAWRFPVVARKVQVDVTPFKFGDPTLGGKTYTVALGIARGDEKQVDSLSPLWIPWPGGAFISSTKVLLPANPAGLPLPSSFFAGYLMSAIVTAQALPAGGPFWPLFFDTAVAPTVQVPICRLPPLRNAGDVVVFNDEFVSSVAFDTGLSLAISTAPDSLGLPPAGVSCLVDFKVGT